MTGFTAGLWNFYEGPRAEIVKRGAGSEMRLEVRGWGWGVEGGSRLELFLGWVVRSFSRGEKSMMDAVHYGGGKLARRVSEGRG